METNLKKRRKIFRLFGFEKKKKIIEQVSERLKVDENHPNRMCDALMNRLLLIHRFSTDKTENKNLENNVLFFVLLLLNRRITERLEVRDPTFDAVQFDLNVSL